MMKTDQYAICFHCGTECNEQPIEYLNYKFCCEGCKMVYDILNQNDLCAYYDLNKNPGIKFNETIWNNRYQYLDLPDFKDKLIQFTDGHQAHIHLHLPQIHCSSCLWLLENLHKLNPAIVYSRVQFTEKKILIVYDVQETSLRKVVELLHLIGYPPHLDIDNADSAINKGINRTRLIKIGIAGFCFTNIMMISLPEYLSADRISEKDLSWLFSFISFTLSLPVLLYCSAEFFYNAWNSLKSKFINIDFPIALAILITFFRSIYEIQSGHGNGYLDSMSGIVFFMLAGRYIQDRSFQSLRFDRNYKSFFPVAVQTRQGDQFYSKQIDKINTGDIILIHDQEINPVDGIITKGDAYLDYSFVTGESKLVKKTSGEMIFAGAKQSGGLLEISVSKPVSQSYLTSLWNKDSFRKEVNLKKKKIDYISQYFSLTVLLVAFVSGVYWYHQQRPDLMWNALTTILIVACPCALLLASSYTNAQVLKILSRNKFYVRHSDILETMAGIKQIVFDKTGTLTRNKQQSLKYHGVPLTDDLKLRIYSLALQSTHPLSQALAHYVKISSPLRVEHFKQTKGMGIEAWIDEHHLKIGSAQFLHLATNDKLTSSTIHIMEDNRYLGCFYVTQYYRNNLRNLIAQLQKKFKLSLISGDNDSDKEYIHSLFKSTENIHFNLSPEQKLEFIKQLQQDDRSQVMMIGDGLNDAGALKQSDVGIAITEDKNNFTPACDGILDGNQFHKIPDLINFIKKGQMIITILFVYSLLYNIIGGYFALNGQLQPIIAAILMPLSSITILLLSYILSTIFARKYQLMTSD